MEGPKRTGVDSLGERGDEEEEEASPPAAERAGEDLDGFMREG